MKNRKNINRKSIRNIKTTACLLSAVFLFTSCKSAESPNPSAITSTIVNETVSETTTAQQSTSESELQTEEKLSSKEDVTEESKEKEQNTEKTDSSLENITVERSTEITKERPTKETEKIPESQESKTDDKAEESSLEQSLEDLEEQNSEERNESEESEESHAQPDTKRTIQDIYNEITQTVDLNSPMILPDNFISNYYGIDVSTLEEYVFSMSEAAISAETIIILKVKEGVNTENLTSSLQVVIDQKKAEMENYLPEQFQIVEKSLVQVKGNYVYLVISEQADAISRIIQAGIE